MRGNEGWGAAAGFEGCCPVLNLLILYVCQKLIWVSLGYLVLFYSKAAAYPKYPTPCPRSCSRRRILLETCTLPTAVVSAQNEKGLRLPVYVRVRFCIKISRW